MIQFLLQLENPYDFFYREVRLLAVPREGESFYLKDRDEDEPFVVTGVIYEEEYPYITLDVRFADIQDWTDDMREWIEKKWSKKLPAWMQELRRKMLEEQGV